MSTVLNRCLIVSLSSLTIDPQHRCSCEEISALESGTIITYWPSRKNSVYRFRVQQELSLLLNITCQKMWGTKPKLTTVSILRDRAFWSPKPGSVPMPRVTLSISLCGPFWWQQCQFQGRVAESPHGDGGGSIRSNLSNAVIGPNVNSMSMAQSLIAQYLFAFLVNLTQWKHKSTWCCSPKYQMSIDRILAPLLALFEKYRLYHMPLVNSRKKEKRIHKRAPQR